MVDKINKKVIDIFSKHNNKLKPETKEKVKFYAMYFEQVENPDRKPLVIGLHGGEGTETIFLTQNFMCEKTSARLSGVVIGNY